LVEQTIHEGLKYWRLNQSVVAEDEDGAFALVGRDGEKTFEDEVCQER